MYIDGNKELAAELSINGEMDVGRKCQGDTSIEQGGQNPKVLGIALEKNQLGEKIHSVGEHKNSFLFPTGLKHLQFQYLQSV